MPRIALACLVLVGGCSFDADYAGGTYLCRDGKCPAGLVCDTSANPRTCIAPRKDAAAADAPDDGMVDARMPALTCVDPGVIPSTGGTAMGTTVGRTSTVAAQCNAGVMNAPDAVYRITASANDMLLVSITGELNAYVIQPCSPVPATPMCIGGTAASMNNPISVTAVAAGQYFIVIDTINPSTTGSYTLTVTVN